MVRQLFWWLLMFVCTVAYLQAAKPEIEVELSEEGGVEKRPLRFVIKVSRDRGVEIDESSFSMEGKTLKPQFSHNQSYSSLTVINGVKESKDLTISTYFFTLPSREEGNYVLDPISVKVGKEQIQSPHLTYQVMGVKRNTHLNLESFIHPTRDIFPGEPFEVGYRIYIRRDVGQLEWLSQDFPLFQLEGVKKIGDVQVSEQVNGRYEIKTLTQKMRALQPGKHPIQAGFITGREYRSDFFGQRSYGERYAAKSAEMEWNIQAFPEEGRPISFNGNVGKFSLNAKLLGNGEVYLGDKVTLLIEVSQAENLEEVKLAPFSSKIQQQFRFNEFLADSKIEGEKKQFFIEMRPLSPSVNQIEAIEFSYFDPLTHRYHTLFTPAISLSVKEGKTFENPPSPLSKPAQEKQEAPPTIQTPIEIYGMLPLESETSFRFNFSHVLAVGLLLIMLYLILKSVKPAVAQKRMAKRKSAEAAFQSACKHEGDSTLFFALFEKAAMLKLFELKEIKYPDMAIYDLEDTGRQGRVKSFFQQLDTQRYSGQSLEDTEAFDEAKNLFRGL